MSSTPTPTVVATADVLAQIDGLLSVVDHAARVGLDADARLALVEAGIAVRRRVEGLVAVLVGEAEEARAAKLVQGTSLQSVLASRAQLTSGEASGLVYAGADVVRRSGVRDAALAGEVSVSQARSIDRVLGELPATLEPDQREAAEGLLLAAAQKMDAKTLAGQGRAVLEAVAPEVDAVEDELARLDVQRKQAVAARAFTMTPDGRGSVLLRGQLPVREAAGLQRLIGAHVEQGRDRDGGKDRLDRLAEQRTLAQRQADALVALCAAREPASSSTTGGETDGQRPRTPNLAGDRPRVIMTMSFDRLLDRAEQAGGLPDGANLTATELRLALCDAEIMPAVLSGAGEPLDVGRARRLVSPGMRRALALRDQGCAFPGCRVPEHRCEAHHIVPWWAGGPTCLANLVLLCPHHHGTVEPLRFWQPQPRSRWSVHMSTDGVPVFTPSARQGQPVPEPIRHGRFTALQGMVTTETAAVALGPVEPGPVGPNGEPERRGIPALEQTPLIE